MSVPNINTIGKIAERYGLELWVTSESGRRVLVREGHSKAMKEALEQIGEGYSSRWHGHEFDEPPDDEPDARVNLYSGKVNWAELGY